MDHRSGGGGLLIRAATAEDTARVQSLCADLHPGDYVISAWPQWMSTVTGWNLVAHVGRQVVGCVHGEGVTPEEGWVQALRVHPAVQRQGIGLRLMAAASDALMAQGAKTMRASVDATNWASRRLLSKAGWRMVGGVRRRRAPSLAGVVQPLRPLRPASVSRAWRLLGTSGLLASRAQLARFGRVYFSWTIPVLKDLVRQDAVIVSADERGLAIIDPQAPAALAATWIVGMTGTPRSLRDLLHGVSGVAAERGESLIVDAPAEAPLQGVMDRLGYDPPDRDGEFLIMQRP